MQRAVPLSLSKSHAYLLALVAGLALAAPAQAQAQADAAPGELIVRFAPTADAGDRADIRERAQVGFAERLPVRGLQVVEVDAGQTTAAAERSLERADGVAYAEPNFYRRSFLRPSDSSFGLQWAFQNTGQSGGLAGADVNAVAAWDITTGSPATTVAVVDSGVQLSHPDLLGSSWTNPGESGAGREANGVDDDGNTLVDDVRGWDWVGLDGDPTDLNGHGTHVAGTVGARSNNARGVAGTSWGARLLALRVLAQNGTGTVANVVKAYNYAAAKGIRIVNASLGASSSSLAERDAIAAASGVLFVVAAGNGGADGVGDDNDRTPLYPCSYPLANVVCVASTGRRDQLSAFSNYGAASVDLAAPGEDILSTWLDGRYAYSDGTSMATPHVAGTAALLLAARPALTVAELRAALLGGVDPLSSLAGRVASGGRLDMRRPLEVAAPGSLGAGAPTTAPTAPAPVPTPRPAAPPRTPAPPVQAPAPALDRSAPTISLHAKRRLSLARVLRRGLKLRVVCSESCSVRLRVLLGSREARRAGRSRAGRAVSLRSVRIAPTRSRRVTLRFGRRARVTLRRLGSARVTLEARGEDAAGNARSVRRRVALTR